MDPKLRVARFGSSNVGRSVQGERSKHGSKLVSPVGPARVC